VDWATVLGRTRSALGFLRLGFGRPLGQEVSILGSIFVFGRTPSRRHNAARGARGFDKPSRPNFLGKNGQTPGLSALISMTSYDSKKDKKSSSPSALRERDLSRALETIEKKEADAKRENARLEARRKKNAKTNEREAKKLAKLKAREAADRANAVFAQERQDASAQDGANQQKGAAKKVQSKLALPFSRLAQGARVVERLLGAGFVFFVLGLAAVPGLVERALDKALGWAWIHWRATIFACCFTLAVGVFGGTFGKVASQDWIAVDTQRLTAQFAPEKHPLPGDVSGESFASGLSGRPVSSRDIWYRMSVRRNAALGKPIFFVRQTSVAQGDFDEFNEKNSEEIERCVKENACARVSMSVMPQWRWLFAQKGPEMPVAWGAQAQQTVDQMRGFGDDSPLLIFWIAQAVAFISSLFLGSRFFVFRGQAPIAAVARKKALRPLVGVSASLAFLFGAAGFGVIIATSATNRAGDSLYLSPPLAQTRLIEQGKMSEKNALWQVADTGIEFYGAEKSGAETLKACEEKNLCVRWVGASWGERLWHAVGGPGREISAEKRMGVKWARETVIAEKRQERYVFSALCSAFLIFLVSGLTLSVMAIGAADRFVAAWEKKIAAAADLALAQREEGELAALSEELAAHGGKRPAKRL